MSVSALYSGLVMHRRLNPVHHRFAYRVFALLLDMDELAELDRKLTLFGWNRFSLFSFHDRDHGPRDGRTLKAWLDNLLAEANIAADGARCVVCYPRILGYVFNPLSVWFCHDRQDRLKAVIYEVHNTYNERHAYVLPVTDGRMVDATALRQDCAKDFYVSPFLSPDCHYHFRIRPPGEDVLIALRVEERGVTNLTANFAARRTPLSDRALLKMFFAYPLMTLKVVAAIHFEAVRLMRKGVARHPHTPKTTAF